MIKYYNDPFEWHKKISINDKNYTFKPNRVFCSTGEQIRWSRGHLIIPKIIPALSKVLITKHYRFVSSNSVRDRPFCQIRHGLQVSSYTWVLTCWNNRNQLRIFDTNHCNIFNCFCQLLSVNSVLVRDWKKKFFKRIKFCDKMTQDKRDLFGSSMMEVNTSMIFDITLH